MVGNGTALGGRVSKDHDVQVVKADLTIEVTKLKVSWIKYLLAVVTQTPNTAGNSDYLSRFPQVAVYNSAGQKMVVRVTDDDDQAVAFAEAMKGDLDTLSALDFCERYEIPATFLDARMEEL